jgi:hypothetical protein
VGDVLRLQDCRRQPKEGCISELNLFIAFFSSEEKIKMIAFCWADWLDASSTERLEKGYNDFLSNDKMSKFKL